MQDKNPFDQFDQQANSIPLAPADPRRPLEVQKLRGDISRQGQQAQADAAMLPAQARKAKIDADKAALELQTAQREAAMQTTVDPGVARAIKGMGLDELLLSVKAARAEVGTGRATGLTGSFLRHFPGTTANDLTGSLESIKGAVIMEKLQALKDASKTGASGMGALSEREGDRLAASVAALNTNLSDEKLKEGLATIERHALALKAVGDGKNPEDPAVKKEYGIAVDKPQDKPAGFVPIAETYGKDKKGPPTLADLVRGGPDDTGGGGSSTQLGLSKDGTQAGKDPALAGANAHVRAMIKRQRPLEEINAYLESLRPGLSKQVTNIPDWLRYSAQNPTKPIDVGIEETGVPLTSKLDVMLPGTGVRLPIGKAVNWTAQSPVGAAFMGAGDILSGGTLDNMSSNPALARAGMAGVAQEHPYATLAGQVAGAGLAGAGVEAGATRLGAGGMASVLAGDAVPGMAYGAGSADEGSRAAGAVENGLAGLIGGKVGRTTGRAVSGVVDPAVQRLSAAGVRLSPGRMLGGTAKWAEDRLGGLPGFESIIKPVQKRSIEDGNRAVFREGLQPIANVIPPSAKTAGTEIGEAGVGNALDSVNAAYNAALSGKAVRIDPAYAASIAPVRQMVANIPTEVGPELGAALDATVTPMFKGGVLSGESMQAIDRGLGELKGAYSNHPLYQTHIRPAIDGVENAVTGLFERQAPEVMPAYTAAKEAYRNVSTINDAVLAAVNKDGTFLPSQLGTAARSNAKKFGGRNAAASGERPFFQLQRDMQNVLPSQIPDSGTAGRLILPGALGLGGAGVGGLGGYAEGGSVGDTAEGAGSGLGLGLTTAAALMSPYMARPVLQKALTGVRPDWLVKTGNVLGASRLPGALALPLLSEGP